MPSPSLTRFSSPAVRFAYGALDMPAFDPGQMRRESWPRDRRLMPAAALPAWQDAQGFWRDRAARPAYPLPPLTDSDKALLAVERVAYAAFEAAENEYIEARSNGKPVTAAMRAAVARTEKAWLAADLAAAHIPYDYRDNSPHCTPENP